MEKVIGRIYTKHRFEALIREKKTGDIIMRDVFVEFPSNVIYVVDGEEKIGTMQTMTEIELWNAATANTQQLTTWGETGEIIALGKRKWRSKSAFTEIRRRRSSTRSRTTRSWPTSCGTKQQSDTTT